MAYRHKLSCRLALLRDLLTLLVPVAAAATCERPSAAPTGPAPHVVQIVVVPESLTLDPAQQTKFAAHGRSSNGDSATVAVTWSASGGTIALDGMYTADTVSGDFLVTATSSQLNLSGSSRVHIRGSRPVAWVSVSPASASVSVGQTVQLTATPKDANATPITGRVVTWTTGNSAVAMVTGNGLVTGVAVGTALITATSEGQAGTAGITVTQPAPGAVDTVFFDGFESGSLALWDDDYDSGLKAGQAARLTVAGPNPSLAHSGSYSMQGYYPAGGYPGALSKFFMPGYDHVRGSMWFRLAPGWAGGTKLFLLRGSRVDNQWSSFGAAGLCPSGTDFFVTDVTFDAVRGIEFYTYYVGEPRESDGVTCYGRNGLQASPPAAYQGTRFPTVDTWHLLEFEVQLNTPGNADGWQKFWLDGALIGTWNSVVFRTTTDLRLNAVTLELSAATVPQPRTIYIDDVRITMTRP